MTSRNNGFMGGMAVTWCRFVSVYGLEREAPGLAAYVEQVFF